MREFMARLVPDEIEHVFVPASDDALVRELSKRHGVIIPHDFNKVPNGAMFNCVVAYLVPHKVFYRCMEISRKFIVAVPWKVMLNYPDHVTAIRDYGLVSITYVLGRVDPICILHMDRTFDSDTRLHFI